MQHISRRHFVTAGSVFALSACAGQPQGAAIAAQVIDDINTVASSLMPLLPALSSIKGIPPTVIANATTAFNLIVQASGAVSSGMSTGSAAPLVRQMATGAFNLASTLAPYMGLLPPPWGTIFTAISVLMPTIQIAVGLAVPPAAGPAPMSVEHARTVLKLVAGR